MLRTSQAAAPRARDYTAVPRPEMATHPEEDEPPTRERPPPYPPPADDLIRAALDRLTADERLRMSDRNRRFLRFVVDEKLGGRAERIKSYTIAVDVFGRADDFDGAADPIVRIEATRLRSALASYYEGPGAQEPVRIVLPKGGYVPEFIIQNPAPAGTDGQDDLPMPSSGRTNRTAGFTES